MSDKYIDDVPETSCTPDEVVGCWKCRHFTVVDIMDDYMPVHGCANGDHRFPHGCENIETEAGTDGPEFEEWLVQVARHRDDINNEG